MTHILGISAFYHDSAAVLVSDGHIVAAAQEERFTRVKHDAGFPTQAVKFCLETGRIRAEDLDFIVFYEKPLLRFERLLETYIAYAPLGFRQFLMSIPLWLKKKLYMSRELDRALDGRYTGRYVFTEHHEAHAASAFFASPYAEAAILTVDGVGEWSTASYGLGRGNAIELQKVIRFPHSVGLLYSAFTYYTGFRVNSGEYKLMGLAPYGEPKYRDLIMQELIDLKEDGSLRLNMRYFSYCHKTVMVNRAFARLMGGPVRRPESPITEHSMDVAASIQSVTEEILLRMARHVHEATGMKQLVMAGGVALNCVANGRILREGPFEDIWVQPAAGDAGGALGAALFVWYQLLENERQVQAQDLQQGSLLGPAFTDESVVAFLKGLGAPYHSWDDEEELLSCVADLIAGEQVVGWFQGRMEFGPRALGNRSILGDARSKTMQSAMNLKIKFRESFRPFAPCALAEDAHQYFGLEAGQESPYMLIVAPVQQDKCVKDPGPKIKGLEGLGQKRSVIPAVTHVDYSARVQTVDPQRHQRLHRLMSCFREKTACSVIINTSFNIRGEPIVCTPEQAYHCFMATNMDVLVLGNQLLYKQEQTPLTPEQIAAYKAKFKLD
jgi:carbamoyltransferase